MLSEINRQIETGQIQNPPKVFSFTIADNDIATIYYDFKFLRILSISNATGVTLRFGMTGQETDVVGAGIGYEMEAPIRNAQIRNQSGASITVQVIVSMGRIYDDRLSVTGTVSISGSVSISPSTQFNTQAKVTLVNAAAAAVIKATTAGVNEVFVTNKGAGEVYIGDSNVNATNIRGLPLQPNQTAIISSEDDIYGHNISGANVDIAVAWTAD